MEATIEWNTATRALMDDPDRSLEFMFGTRWAPGDVWATILKDDPTVEPMIRGITEDDQPLWPERFPQATIDRLRREEGTLFPLIRMNTTADPSLSDFDVSRLRAFAVEGEELVFTEDERDLALAAHGGQRPVDEVTPARTQVTHEWRGRRLRDSYDQMAARAEYLRFRVT